MIVLVNLPEILMCDSVLVSGFGLSISCFFSFSFLISLERKQDLRGDWGQANGINCYTNKIKKGIGSDHN